MSAAWELLLLLRNTLVVTAAVIAGFLAAGIDGMPEWLMGVFQLPAISLYYWLSGESRPAWWLMVGLVVAVSAAAYFYVVVVERRFLGGAALPLLMILFRFPLLNVQRWWDQRAGKKDPKTPGDEV